MKQTQTHTDLPPQILLCEEMMEAWFETMLAATHQYFQFWMVPFTLPKGHACEAECDLDIPGPLERHDEHNLFA